MKNNSNISPWAVYLLTILLVPLVGCASFSPQPSTPEVTQVDNDAPYDEIETTGSIIEESLDPEVAPDDEERIAIFVEQEGSGPYIDWSALLTDPQIIDALDQALVAKQIQRYTKNPRYLESVIVRSEPFLFHVKESLLTHGLPPELTVLPIIESAYKTNAVSRKGAAGLWQFMPATGRVMGLSQSTHYDARYNVSASTGAAMQYLSDINVQLDGNWMLTIASYNAGMGRVKRALKQQASTGKELDFWSLKLPKETLNYVAKFIAVSHILANPEQYGMNIPKTANQAYFTKVKIDKRINIKDLKPSLDENNDVVARLNQGFTSGVTAPKQHEYLYVPIEFETTIDQTIDQLAVVDLPKTSVDYKIRSGDTLIAISKRFGISVSAIKVANNLSNSRIRAGKTLAIPGSTSTAIQTSSKPSSGDSKHLVKNGDTLWSIAKRYGIKLKRLAQLNDLSLNSVIKPGLMLVVVDG